MAQIENTCERREAQRASYGFPTNELSEADRYLLHGAWWEIVHNGYVAEAPAGSGRCEITDEGWSMMTISIRFSLELPGIPNSPTTGYPSV